MAAVDDRNTVDSNKRCARQRSAVLLREPARRCLRRPARPDRAYMERADDSHRIRARAAEAMVATRPLHHPVVGDTDGAPPQRHRINRALDRPAAPRRTRSRWHR